VKWELSRFPHGAAENQQRDEGGACAEHRQTGTFKATLSGIVKKKCAAAIVEPQHAEKKPHVADARGDERLFCCSGCTWSLDPKPDEQIRREPDQFPEHE
jgi:hypothetical protein